MSFASELGDEHSECSRRCAQEVFITAAADDIICVLIVLSPVVGRSDCERGRAQKIIIIAAADVALTRFTLTEAADAQSGIAMKFTLAILSPVAGRSDCEGRHIREIFHTAAVKGAWDLTKPTSAQNIVIIVVTILNLDGTRAIGT